MPPVTPLQWQHQDSSWAGCRLWTLSPPLSISLRARLGVWRQGKPFPWSLLGSSVPCPFPEQTVGSFPGFSPDHHLPQAECRMPPDALPPWLSDRPGWALESLIPREAGLWSQRFSGWPRCHVGSAWLGLFPVPCLGLQKAPGVVSRRVSKC